MNQSSLTAGTASAEEKQWAMFTHLSALLGGLVTSGLAGSIGFFIGPLQDCRLTQQSLGALEHRSFVACNNVGKLCGPPGGCPTA
jgi:uncharacterized Tic20 family protein